MTIVSGYSRVAVPPASTMPFMAPKPTLRRGSVPRGRVRAAGPVRAGRGRATRWPVPAVRVALARAALARAALARAALARAALATRTSQRRSAATSPRTGPSPSELFALRAPGLRNDAGRPFLRPYVRPADIARSPWAAPRSPRRLAPRSPRVHPSGGAPRRALERGLPPPNCSPCEPQDYGMTLVGPSSARMSAQRT